MCSEKKNEVYIDILDVWGVFLSNWDVLFWVGSLKWDKLGQGMVGGVKKGLKKRDVLYGRPLRNDRYENSE